MRFLKVYARVIGMLRNHLGAAITLVLSNMTLAGLAFVDPLLFGHVIDMLSKSAAMPVATLWTQAATLLGAWAVVGIIGIAAGMGVALLAERLAHRKRIEEMGRYYSHVLHLSPAFHSLSHSGQVMKVMWSGADSLFGLWLGFFREQLSTVVSCLVLLPMTMFMNWRLASALIVLVALFTCTTAFALSRTQARQRYAEKFHSKLASTASDALSNVVVVQSFTRLAAESVLFGDISAQLIKHQFPVLNWWAFVNIMTRTSSTLAVMAIVALGTALHVRGQASVGEIVSFMGFAGMLIGRLESMMAFATKLFSTIPNLEEYFSILDSTISVPEIENAPTLKAGAGEVVFRDVSFAYPGGPVILDGVSFTARPGSTVALVGQTGAGKSTAMNLLQRMWDPVSGTIEIDGQDISRVGLDGLRSSIGVVFQESMLFARTIKENLLVGKPDATDAEIERACRMAEAHDFILRQPQGYNTMVGERGSTLSGGQRQRLAIARALLKNPPILVLDEATSALDAATEAKVSKALNVLMAGRTTFVIAHRLSTVRDASEILVFAEGRVAERGSFNELVDRGGIFADLVATQLAPPLDNVTYLRPREDASLEVADAA